MKISGFEKIISLESFEYLSCTDAHEVCSFTAWVREDDMNDALGKLNSDIDFENDSFKFTGHVTDIAVSRDISGAFIEVKTIGKTYKCAQERYSRVFQQSDKTISDILSHMKSMSDIEYQESDDPVIEKVIFQNDESEWSFIINLINSYGFHVYSGEKVFIGKCGKEQSEISEDQLISYKMIVCPQGAILKCRTEISIEMGKRVKYSDKEYYVASKRYILDKEKYYYEYVLYENNESASLKPNLVNAILYAKVTDNDDPEKKGRLQVDFENGNIEDCMKDSPIWIERIDTYASKGFGPIYIPRVDDVVRVQLYNDDCKVIGCVRTDSYGSPYDNCCNDYLLLADDVYIMFADGKITIHNKDNQVEISEEEILITSFEKSIISASKDKVVIQKDKAAIEITADVNTSSGKFIVEAKGDASISGTNVNIKGKSGVSIN